VSPAELPVEMNSFKSQQHRWAKGSIQTCRKLLPQILRSNISFREKAEAFFTSPRTSTTRSCACCRC
jgi:cellulose synthase/poly-beta-1,6-N-acetylglucosamine synthase-like glycosyltransferase